jgi:short-subunit dehydrogenase involved in D-alanine esterification of teichoic acids
VTEIRRITLEGSRPIGRALVQMLEEEGVTVQLPGRHTTEYRDARDVAEGVITTVIAAGTVEAIKAGVRKVRWRFPRAKIKIEGEDD